MVKRTIFFFEMTQRKKKRDNFQYNQLHHLAKLYVKKIVFSFSYSIDELCQSRGKHRSRYLGKKKTKPMNVRGTIFILFFIFFFIFCFDMKTVQKNLWDVAYVTHTQFALFAFNNHS